MATKASRSAARMMISPAVILLLCWMIVPLVMTIYFSFLRYNLITPSGNPFVGWENYYWFFTDPSFSAAMVNTLVLVGGVLVITTVGGIMFALLLDKPMWGQGIIRIMVIAPFFVMPTVSALVWKNMFMDPVNGKLDVALHLHHATALGAGDYRRHLDPNDLPAVDLR